MRFINLHHVVAVQLVTPAENPLVTDDSRMMDVWFGGSAVRKQMFKKVGKTEQEELVKKLLGEGFIQSGNLLLAPKSVLFAEMENEFLGGIVTIGFYDTGKPVELKVSGKAFRDLTAQLAGVPG